MEALRPVIPQPGEPELDAAIRLYGRHSPEHKAALDRIFPASAVKEIARNLSGAHIGAFKISDSNQTLEFDVQFTGRDESVLSCTAKGEAAKAILHQLAKLIVESSRK